MLGMGRRIKTERRQTRGKIRWQRAQRTRLPLRAHSRMCREGAIPSSCGSWIAMFGNQPLASHYVTAVLDVEDMSCFLVACVAQLLLAGCLGSAAFGFLPFLVSRV